MTTGELLLVACVKRGDQKILSVIQKKWLDGSEVVQHHFIMEYFREHGELIGAAAFCEKFGLDIKGVDARPTYYLNEVKERFIFATLSEKIPKLIRSIKAAPRETLLELQGVISSLAVDAIESKDILYSEDSDLRKRDYEERMKSLGVTYLSMGADDMDSVFYGYRKQDLITIGGRAGQGKSWLLVFLTFLLEQVLKRRAELGDDFGDILFITNEMGEEEIKERIDCLKFGLPYEAFMKGTLTSRQQRRYYKGLDAMKTEKSKIRIVYSCQTIDELSTLIGLYRPAAVFIDGSYLMEGKMAESWEKIVFITRNLKRLAKGFKVPIINTTQMKRGTGKGSSKGTLDGQDDFAYSGSYAQDSDIAFRMFQDPDMKFHDLVGVEVVKGRRVVAGTTIIFQNDLTNMNHSLTLPADGTLGEPERTVDI